MPELLYVISTIYTVVVFNAGDRDPTGAIKPSYYYTIAIINQLFQVQRY